MSKLKKVREQSGLSQSKLSTMSGVNVRMIQHYEQGVKDINQAAGITLYKMSKALGVTIEDLLEI